MRNRSTTNKNSRPSDTRRAALKSKNISYQSISNLVPIERYYDVGRKILAEFDRSVDENELDNAYIYGKRFLTFSMDCLPTHDYYRSREQLRLQNNSEWTRVLELLEQTADLMDLEELEKQQIRKREEEALRKIQERELAMQKEEEERNATNDLISKLSMLDQKFPRASTGIMQQKMNPLPSNGTVAQIPMETLDDSDLEDLPPPIPFSSNKSDFQTNVHDSNGMAPPPSYDQLTRQKSEFLVKTNDQNYSTRSIISEGGNSSGMSDALPVHHVNDNASCPMLNPLAPPLPPEPCEKKQNIPKIPLAEQKTSSAMEYEALQRKKKVEVFYLSTYQGRIKTPGKDSTNGCTVISPLVAAYHLSCDGSIADVNIEEIIDNIAPPILSNVRNKLGLGGHALIIPSDVHDYLVDEKILKQDKFVGVCGGNLLDSGHVTEFVNMMDGDDGSTSDKQDSSTVDIKVAATLFFHEHVISIVKVVLSNGTSWYDLVDSLPRRKKNAFNGALGATRTRCKDKDSFRSVLFWYACNAFSPNDMQYIDSNEWDDTMCDLDPRVFQAFAWRE